MNDTSSDFGGKQFTIGSLFFWTGFLAVALVMVAVFNPFTFFLVPISLLALLAAQKRFSVNTLCYWGIGWGFVSLLLIPKVFDDTQRPRRRSTCSNFMRQLALANLNFESAYGEYAAAFTLDENGRRLHSWRTTLLPYIEEN